LEKKTLSSKESKVWDVIIVGGGPAGLSCAIRAAELGFHILVLEARSGAGTATAGSMSVDGYPGFFSITRQELLDKMAKQAKYHATIQYAQKVSKLELQDKVKRVYTKVTRGEFFSEEVMYQGKAVLLATGFYPTKLGVPGEHSFHNKGVFYSLPSGDHYEKKISIIGHTSWAVRNALHCDSIGSIVTLLTIRETIEAHPALLRRLNESFIDVKYGHETIAFEGSKQLTRVITQTKDGNKVPIPTNIAIIISSKNRNRELFLDAGLAITPKGTIIVNSANQDTNLPGVFVAGSATRGDSIVGVSAAEGQKAALQISRYLSELEKEKVIDDEEIPTPVQISRFVEGKSVIVKKEDLSPEIVKWVVKAPKIARKTQPGQFVILRVDEKGERIPLTVAESNSEEGTITLIFQKIGKSTKLMGTLEADDHILNLLGPLGRPVEVDKWGTVAILGGGCGVAPVLPKTKVLKELGNYIVSIISARSGDLLICQNEMKTYSDELHIATDDGSLGHHGFGLDILLKFIKEGRKFDHVVAIGPNLTFQLQ
jgi:thioredoxin reductase/NAD(P)H-flavin reductase